MAVLVVLALVAGVVWLLVAQPWRGAAQPQPTVTEIGATDPSESPAPSTGPSATETPDPSASPSGTPGVAECSAEDVTVEALTDKDGYAADEQPQLRMRLTNTGAVPCTFNVGTNEQRFTISSGSDIWWTSTDCQSESAEMIVTLAAEQVVETAEPVIWDRTRSSPSTCDGDRPRAGGGGASYHLTVEIGGVKSSASRQFQLY